tara:strand:+ start:1072 stop:1251 length:180 start_codon:yes stop_codon:yes gene_type:complete
LLELDHHSQRLVDRLIKTFNKNIELKSELKEKIIGSYGGEKESYIKKWNGLFVEKWFKK